MRYVPALEGPPSPALTALARLSLVLILVALAALAYQRSQERGRPSSSAWGKQFDVPELSADGHTAKPQAILALDDGTFVVTAHFADQFSRAYHVTAGGEKLGQFQFPAPYVHVSAAAKRGDGTIWFSESKTGALLHVDLAASWASGQAVILQAQRVMAQSKGFALDWATVDGREFLLMGEYRTNGRPVLVILGQDVPGRTMAISERVQGAAYRDGRLYIASNRLTGDSGPNGTIQVVDFDAYMRSGIDGGDWRPYVVDSFPAPSNYPEDLTFAPDGSLWTLTEGSTKLGARGWLAAWRYGDTAIVKP